jgi:hypothetical protein
MESKSWWQSKAVWGGIVAALGAISDICVNGMRPESVTALLGAVMAIYGRIVANAAITK